MTNEITRLKEERDRLEEEWGNMLPVERASVGEELKAEAARLKDEVQLLEYGERYESFAFYGALGRRNVDPELGLVPHYAVFAPVGHGECEIKSTITRSRIAPAEHDVSIIVDESGWVRRHLSRWFDDILPPESLGLIKRALFFLLKPVKWALSNLDNGWLTAVNLILAALLALPISIRVGTSVASATVDTGGGVMVGILAELLCLFIIALILVPVVIWLQAERREYRYLKARFAGVIPEEARRAIQKAYELRDGSDEDAPPVFDHVLLLCPVDKWGYKKAKPVKADPIIIGLKEIGGYTYTYKLGEFDTTPVEEIIGGK